MCVSLGLFLSQAFRNNTISPIWNNCWPVLTCVRDFDFWLAFDEASLLIDCLVLIWSSSICIGSLVRLFRLNKISLEDRPLYLILELIFRSTMVNSVWEIGPLLFVCRKISFNSSLFAISASGFLFLLTSLPIVILTDNLLKIEPHRSVSAFNVWKAVAPSTRMSAPVSGIRSMIRGNKASRRVSAVWFGMSTPLVYDDRHSLTISNFCCSRSMTLTAKLEA